MSPDDWRHLAKCAGVNAATARLFHSDDLDDQRAAKAICSACPVRLACLDHAIDAREKYSIWGGRTEGQRRRIRRDRKQLRGLAA